MNYFAVFGNPIEHSKSPFIHQEFAKQENININYEKILVPSKYDLNQAIKSFIEQKGLGANITIPFKIDVFNLFEEKTDRAKIAMSVNTIFKLDGNWCCDNTDGEGLVLDLIRLNIDISQSKILIIGAGGSTRGIINPILCRNPKELFITNRSIDKALFLSDIFDIHPVEFSKLNLYSYDIIINCTSSSLFNVELDIDNSVFNNVILAYDLFYSKNETKFLLQAKKNGAKDLSDGLGMLVFQGALSYQLWRNFIPNANPVIKKLRKLL